jgi:hypothetical protein
MKKLAQQPEASRPEMTVAVRSLTPEFRLIYMRPADGLPAGTELPVYGGNLKGDRLYIPGHTPKEWRQTVEDRDFENELWLTTPPELMAEIDLNEYPKGTFRLLLPDAEIIEKPQFQQEGEPECRVIQHPASLSEDAWVEHLYLEKQLAEFIRKANRSRNKKTGKPKDPKQLFLQLDHEPLNLTA